MRGAAAVGILPLYLRPELGSERADELLLGMEAEVLSAPCPGWVCLRTGYGYTGYARADGLLRGAAAAAWGALPKAVVTSAFCDVLSRPHIRSPLLISLTRGCLVAPVGEPEDGWQPLRLPGGKAGYAPCASLAPWPPASGREEAAFREGLAQAALSYLGGPYRWGGKTPLGIDCSGLVSMAYLLGGVAICRDARLEPGFPVRAIPFSRLGRGDLLYFPGHVAMYLGDGQYIHSTARSGGVVLGSLDPGGPGYRPDLADSLTACGSIFTQ